MRELILTISLLIFTTSCSGRKSSKTEVSVNLSKITGISFSGGAYLWAKDTVSGDLLKLDIPEGGTVSIPHGIWEFFFVGYVGPSAWAGSKYCGSSGEVTLSDPDATFDILMSASDCAAIQIYQEMIAAKNLEFAPGSFLVQFGAVTQAGGNNSGTEDVSSFTTDTLGNTYIAGNTNGAVSEANGGGADAFVMKLDSFGKLLWHTQLGAVTNAGGSNAGTDRCLSLSVDISGNVYCGGETSGALSETSGGGMDAFVMKLDSNGNVLWLTQLGAVTNAGGSNAGTDSCEGISVDTSGNVYCAGATSGGMSEANGGAGDAFVMKLDSNGNVLWHTQLGAVTNAGGSNAGGDSCKGVSVDTSGNVFCVGTTTGSMSETNGGGQDAFVMKLDNSGNILWLTQLGAVTNAGGSNAGGDSCNGISVDTSGNVYCVGHTNGGMSEANGGGEDAFVMKLDSSGNILWHTQLGAVTNAGGSNAGNEYGIGVSVDTSDNVYCGGNTDGAMSETNGGGADAFSMKLDSSGNIIWHTQLGAVTNAAGSNVGNDVVRGISVDASGNVYSGGGTTGSMNETNGGSYDVFVMKLEADGNFNP